MSSNFLLSFIRALKLPVKLLGIWKRNKRKRGKDELEKKKLAYVRNFSPKHYSWQQSLGKDKRKFKKKKTALLGKANEKDNKK